MIMYIYKYICISDVIIFGIFFIVNYCGELVVVENGYILYFSGVVFGLFVIFICFLGFFLLGFVNIMC